MTKRKRETVDLKLAVTEFRRAENARVTHSTDERPRSTQNNDDKQECKTILTVLTLAGKLSNPARVC